MIDIEMLTKLGDAISRIGKKEASAVALLDDLYQQFSRLFVFMDIFERMEIIGLVATGYKEAGKTAKEIEVLERLCPMALKDLDSKGMMASSEDIRMTAGDLLQLGIAYSQVARKSEAREKLQKAKELFAEIKWEMDVDAILEGRETHIGPKK